MQVNLHSTSTWSKVRKILSNIPKNTKHTDRQNYIEDFWA